MSRVRVTTSWDDGHRLDRRVASMLDHYGLRGTFYVAPQDRHHASADRLHVAELRALSGHHEIGSHTLNHVNLAHAPIDVARAEIIGSKRVLEDMVGEQVTSFCYPYGAYTSASKAVVRKAGFTYARTVKRFAYRLTDPLEAQTTVHAYNHWSDAPEIAAFARFRPQQTWRYRDWSELAIALFDECAAFGGDFHLWGHSWELEAHGHWGRLARVLAYISQHAIEPVTNAELVRVPAVTPELEVKQLDKLLITAAYFPPKVGGLERYVDEIARGACDRGHEVVVVTSGEGERTEVETLRPGLRVYRLPVDIRLSNTPLALHWPAALRRILAFEQPDLINPHLPVPGLGDLAARAAGTTPVVITYHSGSMKKRNFILDRVTDFYEAVFLPRTLDRARHIICSSDSVRDTFLRRYSYKSSTVTPGVDSHLFQPRSRAPGGRQVLFVGNFTYSWKGLDYLREAVRRLGDVHLTVIGQGPQVPHVRTSYLGVLHGKALVQAMQRADVLVLPSTSESESFGMVLIEAMSCGVPVVGSRVGGIPQVIEDGVDGLLARPRDPEDLAHAIRATLDDAQATAERVARGLDKVRERFDWHRAIIPRYLEALRLEARPPARRHVTHIVGYYPPHLGGMELVAQSLAEELAAGGVDVQVVTSAIGVPAAEQLSSSNPWVQYLPGKEVAHTPIVPALARALWATPRHTLFHLHAAQAYWPEITLLVAVLRGQRYVLHFHLDVEPSGPLGRLLGIYKATLFRMVMRRAARVLVLQDDQRALVQTRYGVPDERIVVLPNAVRPEFFGAPRCPPRLGQPLRLLYVGRLTVQKRVDRLLEVAQILGAQVSLTVVGDGEDRAALEAQAARNGLTNVSFAGVQRGAALLAQYHEADVFITASDREGMPLTVLEAMATGLPVLASEVTGLADLVRGVGLLASPPSPERFAALLESLLDRPERWQDLSSASLKRAQAHAWPVLSRQLLDVYEDLWR